MQRSVTVSLPERSLELLVADKDVSESDLNRRFVVAIAYFLSERDSDAPGHAYPEFRRGERVEPARQFELAIDAGLWGQFVVEAESQRVSPSQLLEHAALYLAAHRDAGEIAERIARGLRA
jgi:hypothetical protein